MYEVGETMISLLDLGWFGMWDHKVWRSWHDAFLDVGMSILGVEATTVPGNTTPWWLYQRSWYRLMITDCIPAPLVFSYSSWVMLYWWKRSTNFTPSCVESHSVVRFIDLNHFDSIEVFVFNDTPIFASGWLCRHSFFEVQKIYSAQIIIWREIYKGARQSWSKVLHTRFDPKKILTCPCSESGVVLEYHWRSTIEALEWH